MTVNETQNVLSTLEELILHIADGDEDSLRKCIVILRSQESLPTPIIEMLKGNIDLLFKSPEEALESQEIKELACLLAKHKVDTQKLRDIFILLARKEHGTIWDPAGLINDLGFRNPQVPIEECFSRYLMIPHIQKDGIIWYDKEKLGVISQIDSIMNHVKIHFSGLHTFPLLDVLTRMNVAIQDGFAMHVFRGRWTNIKISPREFDERVAQSFLPPLVSPRLVVEALLVPKHLGPGEFIAWREQEEKSQPKSGSSSTNSGIHPSQQNSSQISKPATVITWKNARSPEELNQKLESETSIVFSSEQEQHYLPIFRYVGKKQKFARSIGIVLINLWKKCVNRDELLKFLEKLKNDLLLWTDEKVYIEFASELKTTEIQDWFPIIHQLWGLEWLITRNLALPYKFWNALATYLKNSGHSIRLIHEHARYLLSQGEIKPEPILWLWEEDREGFQEAVRDVDIILNALRTKGSGEYLRAYNRIKELLLDNKEFQDVLVHSGEEEALAYFVKTVQNAQFIEQGQRQSLLVKLIRRYPQAKNYLDTGKKEEPKKSKIQISSYRSVQKYRAELQDIINRQIPENSAAIAHARSYGDLRENFEYKAAKERQAYLMRRRNELERLLSHIQPTDFRQVEISDTVVVGCTVILKYPDNHEKVFHILGALDSDPNYHIVGYTTEFAQSLLGKKKGETVQLPGGDSAVIQDIQPLSEEIRQWILGEE